MKTLYSKEIPFADHTNDIRYVTNELLIFKDEYRIIYGTDNIDKYEIRIRNGETGIVFALIETN